LPTTTRGIGIGNGGRARGRVGQPERDIEAKHPNEDTVAEYETPAKNASDIFERMTGLGMVQILYHQVVNWPRTTGAAKDEYEAIHRGVAAVLRSEWRDTLTASEMLLVNKPIGSWTQADRLNVGWSMECIAVMAWAIQIRNTVPGFDHQFVDVEFVNSMATRAGRDALRRDIKLRAPAELDQFLGEAERWHWCARQAKEYFAGSGRPSAPQRDAIRRAVGENVSLFGKSYEELSFEEFSTARSIALERHRTMNWIWDGEPWDEVSTDT
jgi:hypothetical protein